MEFSKYLKSLRSPVVQGSLNPNIIFLHEKLWPVAWKQKFYHRFVLKVLEQSQGLPQGTMSAQITKE